MFYAQINESNLCVGIHQMSECNADDFIPIDSYNTEYLGMMWDAEKGKFVENPNKSEFVPTSINAEPQPSETELSIMMAIADNYEATQEVKQGNLDIMSAIADMYESNDSSNSNTATS